MICKVVLKLFVRGLVKTVVFFSVLDSRVLTSFFVAHECSRVLTNFSASFRLVNWH